MPDLEVEKLKSVIDCCCVSDFSDLINTSAQIVSAGPTVFAGTTVFFF